MTGGVSYSLPSQCRPFEKRLARRYSGCLRSRRATQGGIRRPGRIGIGYSAGSERGCHDQRSLWRDLDTGVIPTFSRSGIRRQQRCRTLFNSDGPEILSYSLVKTGSLGFAGETRLERDALMADHKQQDDDEVIDNFDQTNGLAPGLDGDDGGAIAPEEPQGLLGYADIIDRPITLDGHESDETGETGYSEEGRP